MIKNVVLEVELWGWVMFFFSPMSGVGHQNFMPLRGGGSCFFKEPGFYFLRHTPPPSPVLFDQPLMIEFQFFGNVFCLEHYKFNLTFPFLKVARNSFLARADWAADYACSRERTRLTKVQIKRSCSPKNLAKFRLRSKIHLKVDGDNL